ncbi:MucBP domain-containing protein [Enterococcus rivorum]|uniref:MucBP domain-containing protein n=1 Tax=Enterococcus rivorum TaxID=762845 RepID=UPI00363C92D9
MSKVTEIQNISYLDVSNTTSMQRVFGGCSSLTTLDLTSWDTSNVEDIFSLFNGCVNMEKLDVSTWDARQMKAITYAFSSMEKLKELDLSKWQVTPNLFAQGVFMGDSSLAYLDLSGFNMTNLDSWNSYATSRFFQNTNSLKEIVLSSNFKFRNSSNGPELPNIVVNDNYTGKWQNVGEGTVGFPQGTDIWTSAEFMNNFDHMPKSDTYVWQPVAKAAGDITVKYVNQAGTEIHEAQKIGGNVGERYDASTAAYQLTIEGYTLDESKLPENSTGILTEQEQTVIYTYTENPKIAGDVTVKYVDQAGTEIHKEQKISGNVGEGYDASTTAYQLTIEGYTLDESKLPENSTGILTEQEQTVTYTYTENPKVAGDVTVKYLDQAGREIHEAQKISGNVGEGYNASTTAYQLTIEGYTLDESKLPENSTGILTEQEQTVTYTYTENPKIAGNVTVKYVDQSGVEIHKEQKISGNIGEGYDVSTAAYQLTIEGYTLDKTKLPENSTGIFMKQSQTILYVYTINRKIPDSLIDTANMFPPTLSVSKDQRFKKLPKTGEEVRLFSVVAGGALVLLGGLVYLKQRKKMNR